jgi:hypothetical protein
MTSATLRHALAACAVALALGACGTGPTSGPSVGSVVLDAGPTQLGLALQSATLVTQTTDLAVSSGKLNRATLERINQLSDAVHAAVGDLEKAQAAGRPLAFDSLNAALSAYNAYVAANVPAAH